MVSKGLLVRVEARKGKDAEVEGFLRGALDPVRQEPATTAWFAVKFGGSDYGIVDFFPDEAGREAHLKGPVPKMLIGEVGVVGPAVGHRRPHGMNVAAARHDIRVRRGRGHRLVSLASHDFTAPNEH